MILPLIAATAVAVGISQIGKNEKKATSKSNKTLGKFPKKLNATKQEMKQELEALGLRLPHGYELVKAKRPLGYIDTKLDKQEALLREKLKHKGYVLKHGYILEHKDRLMKDYWKKQGGTRQRKPLTKSPKKTLSGIKTSVKLLKKGSADLKLIYKGIEYHNPNGMNLYEFKGKKILAYNSKDVPLKVKSLGAMKKPRNVFKEVRMKIVEVYKGYSIQKIGYINNSESYQVFYTKTRYANFETLQSAKKFIDELDAKKPRNYKEQSVTLTRKPKQNKDLNGYRWKPSKADKEEYRRKMEERETLPIIRTSAPIRKGCIVEFYSTNKGEVIKGEVIKHSYGADKGQHTFTILKSDGNKILVKGRNLYPNLLSHTQGKESKEAQGMGKLKKKSTKAKTATKPIAKKPLKGIKEVKSNFKAMVQLAKDIRAKSPNIAWKEALKQAGKQIKK